MINAALAVIITVAQPTAQQPAAQQPAAQTSQATPQAVEAAAAPTAARASAAGCADDGSRDAPAGKPQFAGVLPAHLHRSTCAIAGVDYRVGPPQGRALKRPGERGALPPGVHWDAANHRIRCDGTSGKVIDGIDLATDGGTFYITGGCNNLTIENSRIRAFWGTASTPGGCSFAIMQDPDSSGITIRNTEIDGGGAKGSANCGATPAGTGETVYLRGDGPKIIDHAYLHDVDQHFLSFSGGGQGTSTVSVRHSVITRCGYSQGVHCNGMQWTGAKTTASDIEWNFFYDPQPDTPLGPTAATYGVGGRNEVVAKFANTTQSSFREGQVITGDKIAPGTKVVATHDTGARPVTTTIVLSRQVLGTGDGVIDSPQAYPIGLTIPIKYANDGGESALRNAVISHNTFYGPGPVRGTTYAIHCTVGRNPAANINDGAVMEDNWFSPSNAAGLFYPTAVCTNRFGGGNHRMDSGAEVTETGLKAKAR